MKKLCLLMAILMLLLCACASGGDQSATDTTAPDAVVTEPETDAPIVSDEPFSAGALKQYVVINKSYYSGATMTLRDALRKLAGQLINVSTNDKTAHRIEIVIDRSMTENTWEITYANTVLSVRAFSKVGIDQAIVALKDLLTKSPEKEYANDSVLTKGDYTLKNVLQMGLRDKEAVILATTDKDALSYKVGEEIVFHAALYAKNEIVACNKFSWEAFTADGKTYTGECSGKSGEAEIKIPATGAGFVRLKVYALRSNGGLIAVVNQSRETINAPMFGACVNIDEVGNDWGSAEPTDFDAFWDRQLAVLDDISPDLLSIEPIPNKYNTHDLYRVKIKCDCSDTCDIVSAYITVPKNPSKGSLKINMYYNGYGTQDEFYNFTKLPFTNPDTIFFTVFAHSEELGHEVSYYSHLNNYGFEGNEDPEKSYFRDMILRDVQALRFAKAYFGTEGVKDANGNPVAGLGLWNGTTVTVSGGSQGAFQAFAVTALCPEVSSGGYDVPWMCNVADTTAKGGNVMGTVFRPEFTSGLAYFDTISFAKRISENNQVTITVGLGDYVCPPTWMIALYKQLNCQVKLTFTQGRTHGYTPTNAEKWIMSK